MTKKEYLYELYQAKLITREKVPESEKDSDNVYKISIQGKILSNKFLSSFHINCYLST